MSERTQKAVKECAEWLSACLKLGWRKADLDALEKIWWEHHDENGRLPEGPAQAEKGSGKP